MLLYNFITEFYFMQSRSLYVKDIPGAAPQKRVYDKKLIMQRHQQQIYRFARNPQLERVVDWYVHPRKKIQHVDRDNQEYWRTKRSLIKQSPLSSSNMSKSLILTKQEVFKNKSTEKFTNDSILRTSGRSSLNEFKKSEIDPYFPHMYVDKKMGQSNKWSGEKFWQHEPTRIVQLPNLEQCYFKRWH